MALSEFGLIERFFAGHSLSRASTRLGIGDDCALLEIPDGYQLAVTTDTMVEGVHFFADVAPADLGYKLLAVNLSDLASMGAEPVAVTLALTLPAVNEEWLAQFAEGFMQLARLHQVDLVGGDTTSGPLTLTLQALGLVPVTKAMRRAGAQVGDLIYVSGQPGNAGLGLQIKQGYACLSPETPLSRFHRPEPRVELGQEIREYATACIDLSDGLAQDLGHILRHSSLGACIHWDQLPLSDMVKRYIMDTADWMMPLTAGDDYELCFTVPKRLQYKVNTSCTCIGVIEQAPGLRLHRRGSTENLQVKGFEHFS